MLKKHLNKMLSLEERLLIEQYAKTSLSAAAISRLLGRSKNCVNTEYRKNGSRETYNAQEAHKIAEENKKRRAEVLSQSLSPEQQEIIRNGIAEGWSLRKIERESYIPMARIKSFLARKNQQTFQEKILSKFESLEMQIEILFDQIKQINQKLEDK